MRRLPYLGQGERGASYLLDALPRAAALAPHVKRLHDALVRERCCAPPVLGACGLQAEAPEEDAPRRAYTPAVGELARRLGEVLRPLVPVLTKDNWEQELARARAAVLAAEAGEVERLVGELERALVVVVV